MKYGPQTLEIEEVLSKIRSLTPEQVERLRVARSVILHAGWKAAWCAARDVTMDEARSADRFWVWSATRNAALTMDLGATCAAWDAIVALLTKDLISGEHFRILYGPWSKVMD